MLSGTLSVLLSPCLTTQETQTSALGDEFPAWSSAGNAVFLSLLPGQFLYFLWGLLDTKSNAKPLKPGRELQLHSQSCGCFGILRDSGHAIAQQTGVVQNCHFLNLQAVA